MGPLASNGPTPSFSAIEISRIAPVGQTWLQSVQFSSHQPIFEIMIGVQSPSTPASKRLGCSTLVGQTRMHWSHLMQRRRNSSSATEPGGRGTYLLKFLRAPPGGRAIGEKRSAAGGPGKREEGGPEEAREHQFAAADGREGDLARLPGQEAVREGVVRAVF